MPNYPLIVVSRDGKKEVAPVTVDENGNYRVALPPGDYVLDVQDRRRRHVRTNPQPFTVVSNQSCARGHEHRHGHPLISWRATPREVVIDERTFRAIN